MVRWINLGLALVLATLLVMELTGSVRTEPPGRAITEAVPTVVQETPARRSRRMEALMALEEARRQQRERRNVPAGSILLGPDGQPFSD